jgi:alpha-tubulin suppressor-like RCC1 family protein
MSNRWKAGFIQAFFDPLTDGPFTGGELYIWGEGDQGTLGQETSSVDQSSPVQVGSDVNWVEVSIGSQHTAAIRSNGTYWYWGQGNAGRTGSNVETAPSASSPVQLGALTNWSKVAVNYETVGAVKTDGTLWTWGGNSSGELGTGAGASTSSPIQVGSDTDWSDIIAGRECFFALKTNGEMYSWGLGTNNRTGQGSTSTIYTPTKIGTDSDWASVFAGLKNGVAIKTDGSIYVWGAVDYGQLGNNQTATGGENPTQVGALTNWSTAATGEETVISVKTDGSLWSWGRGLGGALGQNANVSRSSPIQVGSLTTWSGVFTAYAASFGVKTDGTLWSWGENEDGVLGLSTPTAISGWRSSPVQVGSETNWSATRAGGNNIDALSTISFITS